MWWEMENPQVSSLNTRPDGDSTSWAVGVGQQERWTGSSGDVSEASVKCTCNK